MPFISRQEKASWGFPCNQKADGTLWAGKGYEKLLSGQFGAAITADIAQAIAATREDRCGRFWVDLEARCVTMAIGESAENTYDQATF